MPLKCQNKLPAMTATRQPFWRRHRWSWRVFVLLLVAGNCWEWYRHAAEQNRTAATVDAGFIVFGLAVFFISLISR